MEETPFGRQMMLQPTADIGRYLVDLDPRWNCPRSTHGGTVAAVLTSAMQRTLDHPELLVRSVATTFSAPVGPGPAEIVVTVARVGRSVAQVVASIRDVGAEAGANAVAVFGTDRPSLDFTEVARPDIVGPHDSFDWRIDFPPGVPLPADRNTFWDSIDRRWPTGRFTGEWAPTPVMPVWVRYDDSPVGANGALDPLAVVALSDMMLYSIGRRMGPGHARFWNVNADLMVHVLAEARSDWLLVVDRAIHAGGGYALLQGEIWDLEGTLVAYASTTMVLTIPQESPTSDERGTS